nr:immunoglobulin heavy chain junction region [Macaca mulatta]MOV41965.1 immunoglobulin heavy chain junction region [Macaca mulatta]MOV42512.1 immunoglobulin heavy chain junction region [Macaca mulatta]MOV43326.1 immunoglobulin heavy chain junction region [Macaca mulatta]MOV44102.1 immunoglobulin heavy chain junction region [Macaca mulatta]
CARPNDHEGFDSW